ncbi:MAG: M28 family peptidase [Archangium sp.]|nr:M28 family peptidase [Archangium sp.]MDP3151696.1 M28 family peptidase [Archangium sp.]MDP3573214.1 M28 family peptidase [Archangium sp.]
MRRGLMGLVVLSTGLLFGCFSRMVSMPGHSYEGPAATPDARLEAQLRADVTQLAAGFGERNVYNAPEALERSAVWLTQRLTSLGYVVKEEAFDVGERTVKNLIVEKAGSTLTSELIVIGAHYDTAHGTPGADDNGSGVAVGLALAEYAMKRTPARTVRFVFFTNEEPPFFRTAGMGSEVNAKASRARGDDVKAMLALETMGCFTDAPDSQHYPWPFSAAYPSTGNFIAFVGDTDSRELVREAVRVFREKAKVPSEGAALPAFVEGADWSDHGPYWRQGYRALMVTDTAPFRNPHYHRATDVPATVDFRRLALTAEGLVAVLDSLSN